MCVFFPPLEICFSIPYHDRFFCSCTRFPSVRAQPAEWVTLQVTCPQYKRDNCRFLWLSRLPVTSKFLYHYQVVSQIAAYCCPKFYAEWCCLSVGRVVCVALGIWLCSTSSICRCRSSARVPYPLFFASS